MKTQSLLAIGLALGSLVCITALSGCETIEALRSGEMTGKGKRANYSYGLPDRYRNDIPKDVPPNDAPKDNS